MRATYLFLSVFVNSMAIKPPIYVIFLLCVAVKWVRVTPHPSFGRALERTGWYGQANGRSRPIQNYETANFSNFTASVFTTLPPTRLVV